MKGYSAGAGYDLATGLGSVDAYAMVFNWGARPPTPAPVISSLSPNPMTGSTSAQTLTITGSGFAAGATVTASYSGGSATVSVTSLSATQIQATINTGTTARTWTVQVVNPGGVASNTFSLQVVAPPVPPVITSLSPNPMPRSNAAQTLTINGSGFQPGTGLRVVLSFNGSSTTLQGTAIKAASASQIQVTVNVGNTPRKWNVQVVNPDGTGSNSVTLTVK
jgi:hypothetical protein